jgi:hypothetical protein
VITRLTCPGFFVCKLRKLANGVKEPDLAKEGEDGGNGDMMADDVAHGGDEDEEVEEVEEELRQTGQRPAVARGADARRSKPGAGAGKRAVQEVQVSARAGAR